jgi:hypothetical protein
MCIAVSIAYGMLHDQVTARICIEYFTIGHPPVFGSADPTLLGLAWGIHATWWAGAFVGLGLAVAARSGRRRRIEPEELTRPVLTLIGVMAAAAALSGGLGYLAAREGFLRLQGTLGTSVPPSRHVAFIAAGCAHGASYWVGFIGGLVLWIRTWRKRGFEVKVQSRAEPTPHPECGTSTETRSAPVP